MKTPLLTTPKQRHHYLRTPLAALCGFLALWLLIASVLVVWLNHTLTDTPTFVRTLTPLASKPQVEDYFSHKISDQIAANGSVQDIGLTLLPNGIAGMNDAQIQVQSKEVLDGALHQVFSSKAFEELWQSTLRSAHSQLLTQLDNNSQELQLDLGPALVGVKQQLKTTAIAPLVDKLELDPSSANLDIKGENIQKIHKTYQIFKQSLIVLLAVTILFASLAVAISVHHAKTIRRILVATAIGLVLLAALIQIGTHMKIGGQDQLSQAFARTLAQTILASLQLSSIVVAIVCLLIVVASKLYPKLRAKGAK